MSIGLNSSIESSNEYAPVFNGALNVSDGSSLGADSANFSGPVRIRNSVISRAGEIRILRAWASELLEHLDAHGEDKSASDE